MGGIGATPGRCWPRRGLFRQPLGEVGVALQLGLRSRRFGAAVREAGSGRVERTVLRRWTDLRRDGEHFGAPLKSVGPEGVRRSAELLRDLWCFGAAGNAVVLRGAVGAVRFICEQLGASAPGGWRGARDVVLRRSVEGARSWWSVAGLALRRLVTRRSLGRSTEGVALRRGVGDRLSRCTSVWRASARRRRARRRCCTVQPALRRWWVTPRRRPCSAAERPGLGREAASVAARKGPWPGAQFGQRALRRTTSGGRGDGGRLFHSGFGREGERRTYPVTGRSVLRHTAEVG